jgi:hypothetical protein
LGSGAIHGPRKCSDICPLSGAEKDPSTYRVLLRDVRVSAKREPQFGLTVFLHPRHLAHEPTRLLIADMRHKKSNARRPSSFGIARVTTKIGLANLV